MPINQRNPGIRKLRARPTHWIRLQICAAGLDDESAEHRRLTLMLADQRPAAGPRAAAPGMVAVAACPRAYQLMDMMDTVVLVIIIGLGVIACAAIAGLVLVLPTTAAAWL